MEIISVKGERVMAISDVLLEGELTFKTYINKRWWGRLKSEDFLGAPFMDSLKHVLQLKKDW